MLFAENSACTDFRITSVCVSRSLETATTVCQDCQNLAEITLAMLWRWVWTWLMPLRKCQPKRMLLNSTRSRVFGNFLDSHNFPPVRVFNGFSTFLERKFYIAVWLFSQQYLHPNIHSNSVQFCGWGYGCWPQHESWNSQWASLVWSVGTEEMAIRCLVQWCHFSQQYGSGWRTGVSEKQISRWSQKFSHNLNHFSRVHVTQSTLDHLRQEYEVEPGMGHLRNQYLRYRGRNSLGNWISFIRNRTFANILTFAEKTTSPLTSLCLHQIVGNLISSTPSMLATTWWQVENNI